MEQSRCTFQHYTTPMIQIYSCDKVSPLVIADKEIAGKQQKIDGTAAFGGSKKNIVTT